jgi:DNA-directed RNA polymerase subunit RPC12/RpoP
MTIVLLLPDNVVYADHLDDHVYVCWNCDTAGIEPDVTRLDEELVCPRCGGSIMVIMIPRSRPPPIQITMTATIIITTTTGTMDLKSRPGQDQQRTGGIEHAACSHGDHEEDDDG